MHEKTEKCLKMLVDKPEGNRPLTSPKHRWKNNNKVDL
jgi:hypothetical protein